MTDPADRLEADRRGAGMSQVDIRDTPIWRLAQEQIASLSDQEQRWANSHLSDMRKSGHLDLMRANPHNTIYETYWDVGGRRWQLRPQTTEPAFIEAALAALDAVIRADEASCNPDSNIDYSAAISAATEQCRAARALAPLREAAPNTSRPE